ncbi:hypothetical protein A2U01_0097763, partial [Trifolium medium]|nr:hypothetical protein [Trifolium medium]
SRLHTAPITTAPSVNPLLSVSTLHRAASCSTTVHHVDDKGGGAMRVP